MGFLVELFSWLRKRFRPSDPDTITLEARLHQAGETDMEVVADERMTDGHSEMGMVSSRQLIKQTNRRHATDGQRVSWSGTDFRNLFPK